MNKYTITLIGVLIFNSVMLANKIEKAIAEGNIGKFYSHYDSEKVSSQDKKELYNLTKAYKVRARHEYENWPEEQINKKHLIHAAAKVTCGLAITGGLCYAAVRYPRLEKVLFPSIPFIIIGESPAIVACAYFPVITPVIVSGYLAQNDVEKGLHYKSFLRQKYENLETIERRLLK